MNGTASMLWRAYWLTVYGRLAPRQTNGSADLSFFTRVLVYSSSKSRGLVLAISQALDCANSAHRASPTSPFHIPQLIGTYPSANLEQPVLLS